MPAGEIVIVADNILLAQQLESSLATWGYSVAPFAATASLAIPIIASRRPDLVLLDLGLGHGTDGIEAAREIRKATSAPLVFLTSGDDPKAQALLRGAEPCAWVTKPACDRELLSTLEASLARQRIDTVVRQHREWLDATVASVGDASIGIDGDGRVVFLSSHLTASSEWSRPQAIARALTGVFRQDATPTTALAQAAHRSGRALTVVTLGPGSPLEGGFVYERPIDCQITPIRGASGHVTGSVVTFQGSRMQCSSGQRLTHLALHDPLTGLANRRLFAESLRSAIASSRRTGRAFAVLMIDFDHFKFVNDSLGHAAGDALLVEASSRIVQCVRETDTVARLGGDELAVIEVDLDGPDGAGELAKKLQSTLSRPFLIDGASLRISASIGIAVCSGDRDEPEQILQAADDALYTAKDRGRGGCAFAPMQASETGQSLRFSVEDLRRALERSELETYLQPTFSLAQRRLSGAEALVRWNHPAQGLLPAARFIAAAERPAVIQSIVDLSLTQACGAAASWFERRPGVPVSVNLPASVLNGRALVKRVETVLSETSLPPEWLEVEMCGRMVPARMWDEHLPTLRRLSELGVSIGLDRFGRDPWSLLVLGMLPVTKVKTDQSMLHGVPDDPRATAALRTTFDLLNRVGVEVVAVGVENERQLEWLRESGCHQAQGHQLGSPVQIETFCRQHVDHVA